MSMQSEEQQVWSVTQVMRAAKGRLEGLGRLMVLGEISGMKMSRGGHAFFKLRDDTNMLSCVMYAGQLNRSPVRPQDGNKVVLTGRFTCWMNRGEMQFVVDNVEFAGDGRLRMEVEQRIARLRAEGVINDRPGRSIPKLPERIALITSSTGEAPHDVITTLQRRFPLVQVQFFATNVQGDMAVEGMRRMLAYANSVTPAPDVILLVRGGGSFEDRMPFNDEGLARDIAASRIPVVTGIGHKPDRHIADMVSDLACATPTAAAEAVTEYTGSMLAEYLTSTATQMEMRLENRLSSTAREGESIASRPLFTDSYYLTGEYLQSVDVLDGRLERALPGSLARNSQMLQSETLRLRQCGSSLVSRAALMLSNAQTSFMREGKALTSARERELGIAAAKLDALSPLKTLTRGYSITYSEDGHVVESASQVASGDDISVRVKDGTLSCTVTAVQKED